MSPEDCASGRLAVKNRRASRSVAQKGAATFALIAFLLIPSSLIAHEKEGMHGQGHDKLHHWYKTLRQPITGYDCCDSQHCRPTRARMRGANIEVLVDGEWTKVPPNIIVDVNSPDLRTHVCAPKGPWTPKPIFCVVLGSGV